LAAACVMTVYANGQEYSMNLPISLGNAGSTTFIRTEDASVSGVFETRWATATDEYVLEADGTLKQPRAVSDAAKSVTHFGAFDSLPDVRSVDYDYSDTDISNRDGGTVNRRTIKPGDPTVSECGPSPVEPAGIKVLVEEAATRHGVDPGFAVAIVATESDFDRDRNSPKGARGPMQLMPATADRFDVGDVCDPAGNIDGGVRYLRTLLDEFGNPLLAAAAYNAGEHRIYEYGGIPPFTETVSYVAKVVNHQLGLPMPSARKGRAPRLAAEGRPEVGVIAPKRTGSFVAGVMHF